ncbi:hypothetical protein EV193_12039 [Herbihabitans rhizosphaerae]|uniref:Uncharacterized protein n=1 Tax=Herbihabitans rhizosphaerae TaxID=1872711 RepID=A0A4Q7KBP7_9PSEU|nr:hypothetical protein [Herbihabitans rhizosphaerae]RZS29554.1 hypothetical protein EV193_12039 [Herbihabitans rhizosphaerae]
MSEKSEKSVQPCAACGALRLQPGFIEDPQRGYARWIPGQMERGVFGGAKRAGRERWATEAYRCTECNFLNQYVTDRDW